MLRLASHCDAVQNVEKWTQNPPIARSWGFDPPLLAPNRTNKLLLSHFPNRPPNAQTMLELEKFVFGRTIDRRDRGAVVAKTVGYERLYPHEPGCPRNTLLAIIDKTSIKAWLRRGKVIEKPIENAADRSGLGDFPVATMVAKGLDTN
jgi:hypothetical protein